MVMKKTVILLILTLMMVVSGMCYAAGDGSDLNRQQKVADKFMAVLSGDAAAVTQLQVDMVPELAEKMTAANFAALQKQLKEQFGIQKSVRFAVYGDRLTYLVGFSRQQAVRAVYGFDKNGKLSEFVFVPLEVKAVQK
jgi:ABC-type phosphate/phosphonate transport system substrate-binding protein